jgi:hypothetical protein
VTLANEITEKKDQSQGKGSGGFQLPGDPEATNIGESDNDEYRPSADEHSARSEQRPEQRPEQAEQAEQAEQRGHGKGARTNILVRVPAVVLSRRGA